MTVVGKDEGDADVAQDGEGEIHGAVVGVINPPPDLRQIVDKTAMFVAKNGKKFEAKILAKNDQDVKFGFLKATSPYHKYYQKKVDEFAVEIHKQSKEKSAKAAEPSKASPQEEGATPLEEKKSPELDTKVELESASAMGQGAGSVVARGPKLKMMAKLPGKSSSRTKSAPPALTFLLEHPESDFVTLSAARIEVIKLTARFTAALGRQFLSQLALKELNNPEFDFLKPTSGLFGYFTSFVDSYMKIIEADKRQKVVEVIKELYDSRLSILDRCVHRVEWSHEEQKKKQNEADEGIGERLAFLQIDWHDFVVVETIDFEAEKTEETDKKGDKISEENKGEDVDAQGADMDVDMDMDMDVDMDQSDDEKIEIRKDYEPKVKVAEERRKIVTLPDGRQIDADDMNEHVRVDLIDPAYKEQKKRHLEKKQNLPFVQKDISRNLAKMASHRPDVFPVSEEVAKQAAEEEAQRLLAKQRVVWDGSTDTVAEVTMQAQKKLLHEKGSKQPPVEDLSEQGAREPAHKKAKSAG